jgi:hypothetical protein
VQYVTVVRIAIVVANCCQIFRGVCARCIASTSVSLAHS